MALAFEVVVHRSPAISCEHSCGVRRDSDPAESLVSRFHRVEVACVPCNLVEARNQR